MTVFGRYLGYRLKQGTLRSAVFTLISLVITISVVEECNTYREVMFRETGIYILAIIMGVFCTLMPFLELSGFKNRRNLDTLYFFPIKRSHMALAHYLSGAIQAVFIYSVCFLAAWVLLVLNTNYFALGYMWLYYLLSVLVGLMIYSIMSFIFMQANSVVDGAIFCGLWAFVLYLALWVVRVYFLRSFLIETEYWAESADFSPWGIVYAPINNLTVIFQDIIEVNRHAHPYDYTDAYAARYLKEMYMFFIWGALGIAAAVGYFMTFAKKSAHKAGEISDSWFGYRTLIPAYGYMLILTVRSVDILSFIIIALMVLGYAIYRRSFKLKKSDIAFIAGSIIPIIMVGILSN